MNLSRILQISLTILMGEITAATEFKALDEWSSLVVLASLQWLMRSMTLPFKGDDIRNSKTIEDLFNVVARKA